MTAIPLGFRRVTSVLEGVASKMAKLDSDPEVKKAADFWIARFAESMAEPEAVNFAREDGHPESEDQK